jgi:hypothetical protein
LSMGVLEMQRIWSLKTAVDTKDLATKYLYATFPLVLWWHVTRLLLKLIRNASIIPRAAGAVLHILIVLVAMVFIGIYSIRAVLVGFAAALGVASGYFSESYAVGIVITLIIAGTGIILNEPAKKWIQEEFY